MGDTSNVFSGRDYALLAQGWDACLAALKYEDGTPMEVVVSLNPFRQFAR